MWTDNASKVDMLFISHTPVLFQKTAISMDEEPLYSGSVRIMGRR